MTPERIAELRKLNTWEIEECLAEIERLQASNIDPVERLEAAFLLVQVANERDEALKQLAIFREAKDRPWFCRKCQHGYLGPHGANGFKCYSCMTEYRIDSGYLRDREIVEQQWQGECDHLRKQLATLRAEMLRLAGGA